MWQNISEKIAILALSNENHHLFVLQPITLQSLQFYLVNSRLHVFHTTMSSIPDDVTRIKTILDSLR